MHSPHAISPTTVAIQAADPLSHAGMTSQLRPRPEITLMEWDAEDVPPEVVVIVADTVDEDTLRGRFVR
ncbi:hypothetical protein [Streptomyces niveus]|uniref:Uncharacterized protein n=1 Tax=Streptomyces niveus TaxID=193462 RepID=A0ABZ1ZXP5_STRNV|nr:hypothetical protein [Streptomyces niveus]EST31720.1 hypothetical protein M877_06175 [Streptomyces niveus NCIMB 11891]